MKTKELIRQLQYSKKECNPSLSDKVTDEIIQRLLEGEELKKLVFELIDADGDLFEFMFNTLDDDLEGSEVQYFQEEEENLEGE